MIICGSASARMSNDEGQRAEVLNPGPGCKPDLASLTMGSMNFRDQASFNPPSAIEWLARAMRAGGIVPELEFFDLGMVDYTKFLIKKGVIGEPLYGNIILGSLGTLSASPLNLATIVGALPEKMVWSAGGLGRFQFYVNAMAITMGGHVRLGLEDSLYYDAVKTQLATNAGLVERVVKLALAAGREIASPDEARMIIGLPLRNGAAAPISRSLD